MFPLRHLMLVAMLMSGCGGDDSAQTDAGLDAIRRLAITVDGNATLQSNTRSLKVTITANGTTRMDTFAVGGLPSTVDLPAPIQLSTWAISIDGIDMNSAIIGRGTTMVPSGTAETTVTLNAI